MRRRNSRLNGRRFPRIGFDRRCWLMLLTYFTLNAAIVKKLNVANKDSKEVCQQRFKGGRGDWNSPEYEDTSNRGGKKEMKALIFHKMDTKENSDRYVASCFVNRLEAYDEEDDVEPGVVLGRSFMRLTKDIADFGNGTVTIYPKLDPFMDSSEEEEKIGDDWDLLLDDLDFGDIPYIEGVEVPKKLKMRHWPSIFAEDILYWRRKDQMKGEALIEKEDPRAFMISVRLEGKINLNALADTGSDINVMPYRVYKELAQKSLYTTESDSDDEKELWEHMTMKLNPHDPNAPDNTRRLAQLVLRLIYSPCVMEWNVLNQMSCGEAIDEMLTIKLFKAGTNEDIFTSKAWTNAFNNDEPIYSELCHEFYSTYVFDEVCAADELRTKKIIKFRFCGHAFSWTLLEFAKRASIPRVAIPKPPRVSMQDLYERMGSMEIRQGAIERMSYRQSYPWDRYAEVFEHMARVYSVPLKEAYNPPGYDQQQYDQYYQ
ncbi:hypothetical protein Tco_0522754 [Tanacetum coccineum]